ncbi:helix-turn-helix domain-containing protein [Streptomyces sp. NBC_01022]|uniref:helix-turn-helix domain-containing protein n=1 Tax=Streptomyces sp. NBC_01022 TaxID=2903723 RepID=UPI002DDA8CBF|nr:helix-turn-helix domain-containing protein [Streptomyces sp. NBC_01022]WRZ84796.1 helix-turn-helix domain-containing protein [Streptomyces sp. NBC_01022]
MATTRAPDLPIQPHDLNAPYFNVREAAWLMRISVKTLRRRIGAGQIAFSRESDGGRIIVSRQDIDRYYESIRVHALPARRHTGRPRKQHAAAA